MRPQPYVPGRELYTSRRVQQACAPRPVGRLDLAVLRLPSHPRGSRGVGYIPAFTPFRSSVPPPVPRSVLAAFHLTFSDQCATRKLPLCHHRSSASLKRRFLFSLIDHSRFRPIPQVRHPRRVVARAGRRVHRCLRILHQHLPDQALQGSL